MRRLSVGLLVIVLLLIGSATMVIFGSPFADWRRASAEDYLTEMLHQQVTVNGDVAVNIGRNISIKATDVIVKDPARPAAKAQKIDTIGITFAAASAFAGQIVVKAFALDGARLDIFAADRQIPDDDLLQIKQISKLLSGFLNNPVSEDFVLRNMTIDIHDAQYGWNESITIDHLDFHSADDGTAIQVLGKGTYNEAALALKGSIGAAKGTAQRALALSLDFPGSTIGLSGSLNTSAEIAAIDLKIDSQAQSLGDLLDTLQLARVIEGKGHFKAHVSGPVNNLRAQMIDAAATSKDGALLDFSGQVSDVNALQGIDLSFQGKLPEKITRTLAQNTTFDLGLKDFNGRIKGSASDLKLEQLVLHTDLVAAELKDIGPISVRSIARDPKGRLEVLGIHVLNGPPDARTLDITGDITNLLQFSGISLQGKLDIETAGFFQGYNAKKAAELGRLQGTMSIDDADGSLAIKALKASVTDSKLINMTLEQKAGDADAHKDMRLDINLAIPQVAAFSAALDQKSDFKGPLTFAGQATLGNGEPKVNGHVTAGKTTVSGTFEGVLRDQKPHIIGTVSSDLLYLRDMRALSGLPRLQIGRENKTVDLEATLSREIGADLTLKVGKISGSGESVGQLDGRLIYANRIARLDPFRVSFLGGTIHANTTIDLTTKTPQTKSSGRVSELPIGNLLGALEVAQMLTGNLTTRFDISGSGSSVEPFLKTLSGEINVALRDGSVKTDLIDLTGLNLVTWLATRTDKHNVKLVCADMPLQFKDGKGAINAMAFETESVKVVGKGTVDMRNDTIDMDFQPAPKLKQLVDIVSPFHVGGALSHPSITLKQGVVGRAAEEIATLPLNLLGLLTAGDKKAVATQKPCMVPAGHKKG